MVTLKDVKMSQKSLVETSSGQKVIRDIRRATRRQYSAEEKIRIVLDGLLKSDHAFDLYG